MSKKKTAVVILLVILLAVVCGVGSYFGIAYIQAGGTAEGVLDYIEFTVIPALFNAGTFVVAAYIAAYPLISKIKSVVSDFISAKKDIGAVSESGTQMVVLVTELRDELKSVLAENAELQKEILSVRKDFEGIKKAITIGFGNTAELVRNGYARQVIEAIEGGGGDEAQS